MAENWPELAVSRAVFADPCPKPNVTGFWSAGLELTNIYTIRNWTPRTTWAVPDPPKPPIPRNRWFGRPGAVWDVLEQVSQEPAPGRPKPPSQTPPGIGVWEGSGKLSGAASQTPSQTPPGKVSGKVSGKQSQTASQTGSWNQSGHHTRPRPDASLSGCHHALSGVVLVLDHVSGVLGLRPVATKRSTLA